MHAKRDKVIVIGSNSFSGACFIKTALEKGMDVIGISRSKEPSDEFLPYRWRKLSQGSFKFFRYDLNRDLEKIMDVVSQFKPSYIVNYAAQGMVAESWDNPDQWLTTNTLSAVKLYQCLKEFRFLKKFVQISTPEVYGSCSGYVTENHAYNPSTPYAVSKAAADMSLLTFHRQYGFPVVITRSANVYGPGQQLYRIVPRTILFFMLNKTLQLHGGGRSIRSFLHGDDAAEGTFKAMVEGVPGNIYHLSGKKSQSVRELVIRIAEIMNVAFEDRVVCTGDRPGKDMAYLLDDTKASAELRWEPEIDLEKGLEETIDWVRYNFEVLKKCSLEYVHKA